MPVFLLSEKLIFPPPYLAGKDGLLAVGGDLSSRRLLLAYRMGIFPWYAGDDPILWWSPDPRLVLFPEELKVSRSLQKVIRKDVFHITMDTAFDRVIRECAEIPRKKGEGTWITEPMVAAYCKLHDMGYAHSVEVWRKGNLCGGLYGVALGSCFFGESMFFRVTDASKVGLVALVGYLAASSFDMIDCQVETEHMMRFGARKIPRDRFLHRLSQSVASPTRKEKWRFDESPTSMPPADDP